MKAPEELKRQYRDGRLVPFVGAGVSKSVQWTDNGEARSGVLWREFVNRATVELGFDDPSLLRVRGTDLQILEYFKLKQETVSPLSLWLFQRMQPPEDALRASPIHRELAALDRCPVYYTTNYDNLLERAFDYHGRECRSVAIESHIGARIGRTSPVCEIVKFHGDFRHPESMVITESDYQRRLAFDTPMDMRFRADMLGRAVLFLGYGFGDPNVSYLFHLVNERLDKLPTSLSGRRAYITVPDPSDFERTLFAARNIDVLPVNEESHTDDIAALLADLRA